MAHHAHVQLVEGQVATWIDDGTSAMVDDQKLVGLHGLRVLLHQVGEHQTCVLIVAVQLHGFQSHLFYQFVSNREL